MEKYLAFVYRVGDGWGVSFPDVPGVVVSSDDWYQALENASQALGRHIRTMVANGEALPRARPYWRLRREVQTEMDIEGVIEMRVTLEPAPTGQPEGTA